MSSFPAENAAPGVARQHFEISGVSKAFAETRALQDVSFEVDRGEIHALLGSNGCGKSTLIKVAAGVYAADEGSLRLGNKQFDLRHADPEARQLAGLRVVHQQPTVFPDLTVAENLALDGTARPYDLRPVNRRELRAWAARSLERFSIAADPDEPAGALSPARQMMLAIARVLCSQDGGESRDRVLILDEPTANLEPRESQLLFDAIQRYAAEGQAIVLVSHNLDEVVRVADTATVLRDGRKISTLRSRDFSERGLGELIVGQSLDAFYTEPLQTSAGRPVLEVRNLSAGVLRGVDCSVREGEIVGLAGFEGSGATDLLRALFGLLPVTSGEVLLNGARPRIKTPHQAVRAGFAYIPADRTNLSVFPDLSLRENLSQAHLKRYRRPWGMSSHAEKVDARRDVEQFKIRAGSIETEISHLSGGNQQKAVIARWLRTSPRVLLLNDPTQGVDVGARRELWAAVTAAVRSGACALLCSSDHDELNTLSDRILMFRNGRVEANETTAPVPPCPNLGVAHQIGSD